jgi:hypothetical protein
LRPRYDMKLCKRKPGEGSFPEHAAALRRARGVGPFGTGFKLPRRAFRTAPVGVMLESGADRCIKLDTQKKDGDGAVYFLARLRTGPRGMPAPRRSFRVEERTERWALISAGALWGGTHCADGGLSARKTQRLDNGPFGTRSNRPLSRRDRQRRRTFASSTANRISERPP